MRIIILACTMCLSGVSIFAQEANPPLLRHDIAAPFYNNSIELNTKNNSTHKIIKPVAIAAGYVGVCFLSYRFLDEEVQEIVMANQSKIAYNTLKTVGYAGLGTTNIFITAATGASALVTKNKQLEKASILLVGSHLINDFGTHQLKVSFQRHRPNTGDPYNTFDWREGTKTNESFVSNHTSNAFTTATVFAICFPDKKWVPIAAYSTATVVGLSRIYQNAHWTSDVLAGAAIGFLSAHIMNKLYSIAGKKFTFLPDVDNGHFGMYVAYSLK